MEQGSIFRLSPSTKDSQLEQIHQILTQQGKEEKSKELSQKELT
jgi:hypothetical protein